MKRPGRTRLLNCGRVLALGEQGRLPPDLSPILLRQLRGAATPAKERRILGAKKRDLARRARTLVQPSTALPVPLLVGDDPEETFLLLRAFEAAGIPEPLEVLESGEAAMAFLSDEATFRTLDPVRPFSYAFLHAEMPGIEGLDLLHWIAAAPQLRHVPVILLGSSTDPEEVRRVFRLGANSYLLKPLGFEPLVRLVESMHLFWNSWAPTESA